MRSDILKALLENSALLVVAFLFLARFARWKIVSSPIAGKLVQGAVYAACGVLAMLFSVEVLPGVMIDLRAPLVAVATLSGGFVVGILTVVPMLLYRIQTGGTGVFAGIGIILSALVVGMALRRIEKTMQRSPGILFQLFTGIVCAAVYLIWILILPSSIAMPVFKAVLFPITVSSLVTVMAIFFLRAREKAHESLLDRLTEVSNLYEELSLDDNIGILVLQGRHVVYANTSLLEKAGFGYFDSNNTDLYTMVDEKTREMLDDFILRRVSEAHSEAGPLEITMQNGKHFHFLVHTKTMFYRKRQSLLVVSVDISKLMRAEEAIQNRFNQLQLALEASGAVRWEVCLTDDRLLAEEDFFKLLSYAPAHTPPLFSHWLLEISSAEELHTALGKISQGSIDRYFGEISQKGEDLVTRWFNVGVMVKSRSDNGEPAVLTGVLLDTTVIKDRELSEMQKEIDQIQSHKMEAIGRLAGGIAHDFNNLLHVILGYSDILKRVSSNDPVVKDISVPIIEAAEKGTQLVRQLLLFSRDRKPVLQSLHLDEITRSFSTMVSRIMEDNIIVETEINVHKATVYGDSGQLEQVLMNLCVNARDAMPHGGCVLITLDVVQIKQDKVLTTGSLKPGSYVALSISDTGPGIPEERQRRIFDPFFTTKKIDKGTGLGLSTVLGIVREHSGYINVKNRVENGLTITVYLPELKTYDEHKPETAGMEETGPNKNIQHYKAGSVCVLVAEDDPRVMTLAVEGLGAAGITVLKAADGKQAVDVFRHRKDSIDMLVFDVMMPEMSGPDAYNCILSENGNDQVPVVFTTGYAGDRLLKIEGRYEVIRKPYSLQDLVSVIRRMTDPRLENNE